MARSTIRTDLDFRATGGGAAGGTPVTSNAARVEANFAELFTKTIVCRVSPNGTARADIAPPAGCTIAGVALRRGSANLTSAGAITAAVKNGAGTTVLSTATVDAKALTGTFVNQTLTGTGGDLVQAAGDPTTLEVVSNNPDATAGTVIAKITYAATP